MWTASRINMKTAAEVALKQFRKVFRGQGEFFSKNPLAVSPYRPFSLFIASAMSRKAAMSNFSPRMSGRWLREVIMDSS